ncbi:MAG: 2Fe-2S iron-sulfur cluster-binding protein [Panacagrimonas sp.]
MELLVQPLGRTIPVEVGVGLLDCLIEHKVPVSYSCRDGRCGMCTCRVVEGRVLEVGKLGRGVPVTHQASVLACQSVLSEDCVIHLPDCAEPVVHAARLLKVPVLSIDRPAPHVRDIRLAQGTPRLAYSPGQHVEIEFAKGLVRRYSFASVAEDEFLRFNVQGRSDGRAWEFVEKQLLPGTVLKLRGPLGSAYLRNAGHKGLLMCSAGVGLSPVMSMLRRLAQIPPQAPVLVAIGFPSLSDSYGLEELESLVKKVPSARLRVCVSQGRTLPRGMYKGLLTEWLRAEVGDLSLWRAYAYGTSNVVESVVRVLRHKGVIDDRLHIEGFYANNI